MKTRASKSENQYLEDQTANSINLSWSRKKKLSVVTET